MKTRMRPGGFEPPTYGLGNRCASPLTIDESNPSDITEKNLAFCLALLKQKSPDLALLVERWDDLPEAVKAGIVAMIDSTKAEK